MHSGETAYCRTGPFVYTECCGTSSAVKAVVTSFLMAVFSLLARFAFVRRLLSRFMPAQGQGPSEETRAKGFFRYRLYATLDGDGPTSRRFVADVAGGDPGYDETAKMLAESGLAIAFQRDECPGRDGGVLTPATAMGGVLIERLRRAGLAFTTTG